MFTIRIITDGVIDTLYHPLMVSDGYAITAGSVDLELGKAGSATITIPKTNPAYNKIAKMKTIVQIMNDREELFCGRVLHDEKDFYGNKELYLEGNLAYLIDRIMEFPPASNGYKFAGKASVYLTDCMNHYNQQIIGFSQLETFDMSVSHVSATYQNADISFEEHEYVTVQDAIYDKIVNVCGGYLKTRFLGNDANGFPQHTLDYVDPADIDNNNAGAFHLSSQQIEFGENLLDLSEYVSAEDTFTVLIPLGKMQEQEIEYPDEHGQMHKKTVNTQRYDISGVQRNPNVDPQDQGQLYVRDEFAQGVFGNIWKTVVWDDIEDPNQLYGLAHNYLGQYNHITTTLTINAVDLSLANIDVSKFHIGDYVRVYSLPHSYNKTVQCRKISVDLLNPGNSEYTFETPQKTISEMQSTTASNVDSVKMQMSSQVTGGSGSVDALESRITTLENSVLKIHAMDVAASPNGWRLTGDGLCASDSNFKLVKYLVFPGQTIYVNLSADDTHSNQAVYQWQKAASVPSSGTNANLIGTPVTVATNSLITAPLEATYIIISQLKTNETNFVAKLMLGE